MGWVSLVHVFLVSCFVELIYFWVVEPGRDHCDATLTCKSQCRISMSHCNIPSRLSKEFAKKTKLSKSCISMSHPNNNASQFSKSHKLQNTQTQLYKGSHSCKITQLCNLLLSQMTSRSSQIEAARLPLDARGLSVSHPEFVLELNHCLLVKRETHVPLWQEATLRS